MAQYKAANLSSGAAFMQSFGNTVTEVDTVSVTTNLALNDTIDLVRVAGGTKLFSLETFNDDVDTGTAALVYKIGYRPVNTASANLTADDDFFGSSLQAWRAAVAASSPTRYAFDPVTFNEDVIIYATVTTAGNALSAAADITTIAQGIARGIK